jgi:hypothetical protein
MQVFTNEMDGVFSRRRRRSGRVSPAVVRNRRKFLSWMKRANPTAYRAIMRRAGLSVMSAETDPAASPSIWESIVTGAKEILPTLVQARAQKQIFDAQLKRAKRGLAPLETSQIAPTIRIETGVSRGTGDMLKQLAIPLTLGVAGLAAVFLLKKKKK